MKYFFITILILSGFFLGIDAAKADYRAEGAFRSEDLLSGVSGEAWITGFYATSSLPASTSIEFQFSNDNTYWRDVDGRKGYWTEMSSENQYFDLRALKWATSTLATSSLQFFYRARLKTEIATVTPVIYEVSVEFSTTYDYTDPDYGPWINGSVRSTDLLAGVTGEAWITGFYATTSQPANTEVELQFSSDGTVWRDRNGTAGYWTTMSSESEYFYLGNLDWSLSGLSTSSLSFYYRARLVGTTTADSPILYEASVEYSESDDYAAPDYGYWGMGAIRSINLLSGVTDAAAISGFYATTSLPASTSIAFQFSYDNTNWYDESGDAGYWEAGADGGNYFDLRSLGWASSTVSTTTMPFYFRARLMASSSLATSSVLYEVSVEYENTYSELSVVTHAASDIGKTTAIINAEIGSLSSFYDITEHGFYWATSSEYQIEQGIPSIQVLLGTKSGASSFASNLSNLSISTEYVFMAYATLSSGDTVYGDLLSFITLAKIPWEDSTPVIFRGDMIMNGDLIVH